MTIHINDPGWTVQTLTNLFHMLYARQALINAMLQTDFLHIDAAFTEKLPHISQDSVSDLKTLLSHAVQDGTVRGVNIEDGIISLEIPVDPDSVEAIYCTQLVSACVRLACISKRVLPRSAEQTADKYSANAWLNRLGFRGHEYKDLRHAFVSHLPGYAAFKTEDRMQAHKDKLAEQRRIRRENEVNTDD